MRKTYSPKGAEIQRQWFVVDASGAHLGRLAASLAHILRGKHKPMFVPHLDTGDFVVVVNAEKVVLTGRKEEQKMYYRHSGRPGGLKSETARQLRGRRPTQLLEHAVRGMLPKGPLGRQQFRKLKVYVGSEHPHQAQQPTQLALGQARS